MSRMLVTMATLMVVAATATAAAATANPDAVDAGPDAAAAAAANPSGTLRLVVDGAGAGSRVTVRAWVAAGAAPPRSLLASHGAAAHRLAPLLASHAHPADKVRSRRRAAAVCVLIVGRRCVLCAVCLRPCRRSRPAAPPRWHPAPVHGTRLQQTFCCCCRRLCCCRPAPAAPSDALSAQGCAPGWAPAGAARCYADFGAELPPFGRPTAVRVRADGAAAATLGYARLAYQHAAHRAVRRRSSRRRLRRAACADPVKVSKFDITALKAAWAKVRRWPCCCWACRCWTCCSWWWTCSCCWTCGCCCTCSCCSLPGCCSAPC